MEYRLQSMYNHMVERTASVVSPFYSLLPGFMALIQLFKCLNNEYIFRDGGGTITSVELGQVKQILLYKNGISLILLNKISFGQISERGGIYLILKTWKNYRKLFLFKTTFDNISWNDKESTIFNFIPVYHPLRIWINELIIFTIEKPAKIEMTVSKKKC